MKIKKIFVLALVLACAGLVTYHKNKAPQDVWHTVNSEIGQKCLSAARKKANGNFDISPSDEKAFLLETNPRINRRGKCNIKLYSFYVGGESLILYDKKSNIRKESDIICIQNKTTSAYNVFVGSAMVLDLLSSQARGNMCEQYEAVAQMIEEGLKDLVN